MTRMLREILIVVLLAVTVSARAEDGSRAYELRDSLEQILAHEQNPDKKISLLYNIYDLSTSKKYRDSALHRLYDEAGRADRFEVQLDVLTHLANINRDNDTALVAIKRELEEFVDTPQKKEVKLFVQMLRVDVVSKHDSELDNNDHLTTLFKRESLNSSTDPYERALMLYTLCVHLGKTTRGELLEQYLQRLEDHIESINLPSGYVRNLIYTRAAPVFTNNQNYKKAVEIDKKMINVIDSLCDNYKMNGRPYRDLTTNRFVCYRRLLGNYKGLSQNEIEPIYNKICELAEKNSRVANDLNVVERTKIFYYLATDRNEEAVAAIKRQIDRPANKAYRFYYLNALVGAAEKIGDKQTQLEAAVELNGMLRDEIDRRISERYRELEIIYDVNSLKEANAAAVMARDESRSRAQRIIIIIVVVVVIIMFVMLALLYKNNRKVKRMAAHQERTSERLRNERNELKQAQMELIDARDQAKSADKLKTDFINNMSHEVKAPLAAIVEYSKLIVDCVPEDKNKYLKRFANIIELNSKLIMTLLNDVLDIASLEHGNMSVDMKPSSVYDMCAFALDNLFEQESATKKGVKVEFNSAGHPDLIVRTDSQRVGQVLINLLSNADKFTEKGTIRLDFEHDEDREELSFIVSDTGIGVPVGQEEAIFSRFRKLDNSAPGCGLGLYISRLLAKLLGGDVRLDTKYRGGARFIFTVSTKE